MGFVLFVEKKTKFNMELKNKHEYIIQQKNYSSVTTVLKIYVLELTQTSILFKNLDNSVKTRMLLFDFNKDYLILEDLGETEIKDKIEDIFNKFNMDKVFEKFDDKFKNFDDIFNKK